jgi:hypothetical protein
MTEMRAMTITNSIKQIFFFSGASSVEVMK